MRCWHCGELSIAIVKGGWVCTFCGQHGNNADPVDTKEEGVEKNRPYLR